MTETDNTFSAGETKLLISILRNSDGQINSNWDRVAEEMGYKDASIAKTRWGQIKKKKISGEANSPTKPKASPKTSPKKPAAKRKAPKDKVDSGNEEELGDGNDEEDVPKKSKIAKTVKEEIEEE